MSILVTGGAGFIGSALVEYLLRCGGVTVVNVDKLTYAANPRSIIHFDREKHTLERVDICDFSHLNALFEQHKPCAVLHLAAESHVDRSIDDPTIFIKTNLIGTSELLKAARRYWATLDGDAAMKFRFLHVSTDEVFGDLAGSGGYFTEHSTYAPSSPYAATKAGSDHLVRAWGRTFGLPVLVTNCSNNYGPRQFPEKLIPHMILNALAGKPLPVYGDGSQIRDWLYVEDHARALWTVLQHGRVGETYNIGGHNEKRNIDVVRTICRLLDKHVPSADGPYERLITFVTDRPGHDTRYAIDASKIERELGWKPEETFETGLEKTVKWYLENRDWWQAVLDGSYKLERLGEARAAS